VLENLPATVSGGSEDPRGELMLAALSQLPWAQKELLSLFYLEGLSLNETGQVLRLAPRVVRKRLFRARKALRRRTAALEPRLTSPNATPQAKEGSLP
jgi:DNA-directed RNA polymerase specialized sigma24 family protein